MDYTSRIFSRPPANVDSPVLTDADRPDRSISWAQYASATKRIAVGLHDLGVEPQDGIGLVSSNDIYYYVLADGAIAAGAIFIGIPPPDRQDKLATHLIVAQIKWLFATPGYLDLALATAAQVGIDSSHVLVFDPPGLDAPGSDSDRPRFSELLNGDETLWQNANHDAHPRDLIALRLFTSGTTGNVKAAELSHAALVARLDAKDFVPSNRDRSQLQYISLSSAGGQMICQRAFAGYLPAYISGYGDELSIIDKIQSFNISVVQLPPRTMELMTVSINDGVRSRECLNSLTTVLVGGATSRPEGVDEFAAILPDHAFLRSGYGSTEFGIVAMTAADMDAQWRPGPGYVGLIPLGVELRFIDHETFEEVGSDGNGEICVRGESMFSGYCNNPAATSDAFLSDPAGGKPWFRTGDRGYLDVRNNQLALTGRFNEMFTAGLARVVPSEVEAALMEHGSIQDAAVTATKARDIAGDNECIAYVVRKMGAELTARQVVNLVSARLSNDKAPTGGVVFCDSIPRNPMKKVMRHKLAELEPLPGSEMYLRKKSVTAHTNGVARITDELPHGNMPQSPNVQAIAQHRAISGQLDTGVGAQANVEQFKTRAALLHKTKARRWDHRLTNEATLRKGNSMIASAKWLHTPDLVSLGGGLPSIQYFPIEGLQIDVPKVLGPTLLNGHMQPMHSLRAGKHDIAEQKSQFDVGTALQYGQAHGHVPLLRYLVEHTELVHAPSYKDWSCTMTGGNTAALEVILRLFAKPGSWMLSEEYTFVAAVETAAPLGVETAAVSMDEQGMRADGLDSVLSGWEQAHGPKPFLLYTVPTGQNPTGTTQTVERRRDIYAVAQKHDLLILEDDPYYFLQMRFPVAARFTSHDDFLKSLVPSYLSLDTDGRVIRMDSFSKVIAPGMRTGWITASEQIVDRYRTHVELSTQGPSGMSQLAIYKILEDHWGHAGYLDWLMHLRGEYTARRDVMLAACERHLPRDVVSWVPPVAGMFYWLRVDHTKYPRPSQKLLEEIEEEISEATIQQGTHLMQGSYFRCNRKERLESICFRAAYAAAPVERIEEGIQRFGNAVRKVFELTG